MALVNVHSFIEIVALNIIPKTKFTQKQWNIVQDFYFSLTYTVDVGKFGHCILRHFTGFFYM
jgi:hypothetical protein